MVTVQYTIRSFFVLDKGDLLKNILAQVSLHKVWVMIVNAPGVQGPTTEDMMATGDVVCITTTCSSS